MKSEVARGRPHLAHLDYAALMRKVDRVLKGRFPLVGSDQFNQLSTTGSYDIDTNFDSWLSTMIG